MPALQEIASVMRGANKRLSRVYFRHGQDWLAKWECSNANYAGTRADEEGVVVAA